MYPLNAQESDITTHGYQVGSFPTLPDVKTGDKWLPAIIVSLYYLTFWAPPIIPTLASRWYVPLGLAIFAFIIQKASFSIKAARLYWGYYLVAYLGAIISLTRTADLDQALWNTLGMGISFIIFLIFLPIIAQRKTRRILLVILVGTSFLWTFEIQRLANTYGTMAYSTFAETGENKNAVGYSLALSVTVLFYMAYAWQPSKRESRLHIFFTRTLFVLGSFYLMYYEALIYARGSLISSLVGGAAVLVVHYLKRRRSFKGLLQIGFLIFLAMIGIALIVPRVLEIAPYWNSMYERASMLGAESVTNNREMLLRKGIYLISQNPFIGLGIGGSRAPVVAPGVYFPGYLFHNTFLTDWAELGVLGLISNVIWIIAYINIVRRKFWVLPRHDQIWLLLFIPLMVQLNLKNVSSVVMVVILAGIYYEQFLLDEAKQPADYSWS